MKRFSYDTIKRPTKTLKVLFISTILVFSTKKCMSQFSIDKSALGLITNKEQKALGTAFLCGNPSWIVTCAHVEQSETGDKFYIPIGNEIPIPLKLLSIDPKQDVAIYQTDVPISDKHLNIDTTFKFKVGAEIVYAGYDVRSSVGSNKNIKISKAVVISVGIYKEFNIETYFIEFIGEGIPGYSGGPVFNLKGELIGIFAQSYYRKPIKIGYPDILINRAFTIKGIYDRIKK